MAKLENKNYSLFLSGLQHKSREEFDDLKVSYIAGRSIRFIVSIPCAIVDLALQILEVLSITIAHIICKIEFHLTGGFRKDEDLDDYLDRSMGRHLALPAEILYGLRKATIAKEMIHLGEDVGLLDTPHSFFELPVSSSWYWFLYKRLYPKSNV